MNQKDQKLHVEFRQSNCSLSSERLEYMASEELKLIPRLARELKFEALHVDIHKHPHKEDFHIKMNLHAGSRVLFTGERHDQLMPAYRACVSQMISKLREAKEKQRNKRSDKHEEAFAF